MKNVSVSTTAVVIIDPDNDRVEYIIQNVGSVDAYIGSSPRMAASGDNAGRKLFTDQSEWFSIFDAPMIVKGPIYGITAAGTTTINVEEFFDKVIAEAIRGTPKQTITPEKPPSKGWSFR